MVIKAYSTAAVVHALLYDVDSYDSMQPALTVSEQIRFNTMPIPDTYQNEGEHSSMQIDFTSKFAGEPLVILTHDGGGDGSGDKDAVAHGIKAMAYHSADVEGAPPQTISN